MKISINQLADFSTGTDSKKRRIIDQQKNPNQFKMAWYQLAKSSMKRVFINKGDFGVVNKAISTLKSRKPEKKRQIDDNRVSIEALQRFIKMKLPSYLNGIEYDIIKPPKQNSIFIDGLEIIVSPDVILKLQIEGTTYIGAIKIHISKSNAFNKNQQGLITAAIYSYLNKYIAKENEIVLNDLCLSLDIFGGGFAALPPNNDVTIELLKASCEEVKMIWNAA